MSDDMSNIIKQFSNIMNKTNASSTELPKDETNNDELNNLINMFKSSNNTQNNDASSNIDFETIFKIKNMYEKMNNKTDNRTVLLNSLKPYLNDSRKEKLDQYINFLKISNIIEAFGIPGIKKEGK